MTAAKEHEADFLTILSHSHDNGGEYWATPDLKVMKGAPFSTVECADMLVELGMDPLDPVLLGTAELLFSTWHEDGRFKVAPTGGILPCHTAIMAATLCRMGYAEDRRVVKTLEHLLETQYQDGGWRCNKFSFGRGPETEYSNPQPTLNALDAFRFSRYLNREPALDRAVGFLLEHWTIRKPIGPCHYGMGTLFMQVEYPFRNYNLFYYVHVLSYYNHAKEDPRFLEAFAALETKVTDGQIVVERVVPKLAKLDFCRKGEPSPLATRRFREILQNLGRA